MENKEKNNGINRTAYLTILTLLALLAILAVATSSANRARREGTESTPPAVTTEPLRTTPQVTTKEPLHTTSPDTTAPEPTQTTAPSTTESTAPSTTASPTDLEPATPTSTLPEFRLPVSGQLLRAHDLDVPVWSTTMADYRTHCGMDIAATRGASVCAAADGVIAQIWEDPMMGQCLSIKHSGEAMTIYRNLAEILPVGIEEGVTVRTGQLIGNVGESAMIEIAEEPHVHFELMIGEEYVNPLDYLSASVKTSLNVDTHYED